MEKVFYVFKTKKGLNFLKKISEFRFIKVLSTISILVAVYFMFQVSFFLLNSLYIIFTVPKPQPTITLALPGVKIPGSPIYIPFLEGIISIFVLAIVHEFSHAIVALNERIRVKNLGFGLFIFLPIAFTEVDEKQMLDKKRIQRLRVASAGSIANITLAFILFYLISTFISPVFTNMINFNGIKIVSVERDSPAFNAGLKENMIINRINDLEVLNITQFIEVMNESTPNQTVPVQTENETFYVKLGEKLNKAYLGITVTQNWEYKSEMVKKYGKILLDVFFKIFNIFVWIANLNLSVGIVNLIPLWIADGGRIVYDILSIFIKERKTLQMLINIIFSIFTMVLILNIIAPYIYYLYEQFAIAYFR
jgi:membrane-associated protease RseP (regulator of RpoE activity)